MIPDLPAGKGTRSAFPGYFRLTELVLARMQNPVSAHTGEPTSGA